MPEISRFLGIVITMYFNDHNPPHFHARYEEYRALIGLEPLEIREGQLPPRVLGLVLGIEGKSIPLVWRLVPIAAVSRRFGPSRDPAHGDFALGMAGFATPVRHGARVAPSATRAQGRKARDRRAAGLALREAMSGFAW